MTLFPRISAAARAFVSPETKGAGGFIAWLTGADGAGSADLSDPYNLSPWVSSAIQHIARPISQVPLEFFNLAKDGGLTPSVNTERDAFWKQPAKGEGKDGEGKDQRLSMFDTMEATVGWLLLKGSFAWVLDDSWMVRGATNKSPILIVDPDRLAPIMDAGELIGWRLRLGHGRFQDITPEQVAGSRFWNPTERFTGSAPMKAAQMAAEADYATSRHWKFLAESNGDLGETITAPNGITPAQEEQIKVAMRQKREAAKRGKFLPRFFVGDVKTESPKIQAPDAASVTQRLQHRHEIYIAFGVPASFAEVMASYSVGSASDRFKLIEETCQPISVKIAQAVEHVCRLLNGEIVSARFNFDEHSTMQAVRAERIEAGRKLHERGMPWDVVSDTLKLRLPSFAGSSTAWLPFNLQAVEVKPPAAPVVAPVPELPATKALTELEVLLRGCPAHGSPSTREQLAKTAQRTPDEKAAARAKRWEAAMRTRAPFVKKIRAVVDRALYKARTETLGKIDAAAKGEKGIRSGAFDFIFDLEKFLELLIEPIFKLNWLAYETAGAELVTEDLGVTDSPFLPADPAGLEWLQARKNFIKDAGVEVWTEIRDSLDQGIQDGESYEKLAARVRDEFNGLSKERSMKIAVTETSIAFESGRHDAMVQNGAEWKEWLSSGDDRVRDTHRAIDGQVIPIDEPFNVGGALMQYPCDPSGPGAEIIHCRCIHGPAMEPVLDPEIVGNDPTLDIPF